MNKNKFNIGGYNMCNKKNVNRFNTPSTEINTRNDYTVYEYTHTYVDTAVESSGTTPIDISLMTGNGEDKEGE